MDRSFNYKIAIITWLKSISEKHRRVRNIIWYPENRLYLILSSFIGLLFGITLTYLIVKVIPIESNGLKEARRLGIISSAVVNSYPKDLESFYYFFGIIVTISITLFFNYFLALYLCKRKYNLQSPYFIATTKNSSEKKTSTLLERIINYAAIPLLIFFLTFDTDFILNSWFAPWSFFGEEGMHYAWANEISNGKVLYRDTLSFYGPLMSYSLFFIGKIFKPSVLIFRIFCYLLYFAGYLIIYYLVKHLLQKTWCALCGIAVYTILYFPVLPAIHDSTFRVASGLWSLLLIFQYIDNKKKLTLFLSGIIAGIALLFSHEVGIITLISSLVAIILSRNFTSIKIYIVGFIASIAPMLIYFLIYGALLDYLRYMIDIPTYYSIGLFSRPFPNIENSFINFINIQTVETAENFLKSLTAYWPILLYSILLTILLQKAFFYKLEESDIKIFSILVFGILYFKVAFGMSGLDRNLFCLPPGIILSIYFLKGSISNVRTIINQTFMKHKRLLVCSYLLFTIFLCSGFIGYMIWPGVAPNFFLNSFVNKISFFHTINKSDTMEAISIERCYSIKAPKEWAEHIRNVVIFITSNTSKTDLIYAFPREPIYYFLCNRVNPTRFINEFNAVTSDMRKKLYKELEENKPAFIIYSYHYALEAPIPIEERVPEVINFIERNYFTVKDFGGAKILKLKKSI